MSKGALIHEVLGSSRYVGSIIIRLILILELLLAMATIDAFQLDACELAELFRDEQEFWLALMLLSLL